MDLFPALFLICWFAIFGGAIIYNLLRALGQRKRITEHLQRLGARNVTLRYRFFDFDKTNFTYDVHYQDAWGISHQTVCKARASWLFDQSLYWEQSPETVLGQNFAATNPSGRTAPPRLVDVSGSLTAISLADLHLGSPEQQPLNQEQLISQLIVENNRLRAQMREHEPLDTAEAHW